MLNIDQSTLYMYMKMSQWNPFVQLIYANKNMLTIVFPYDPAIPFLDIYPRDINPFPFCDMPRTFTAA
jgi:hypothetical protein